MLQTDSSAHILQTLVSIAMKRTVFGRLATVEKAGLETAGRRSEYTVYLIHSYVSHWLMNLNQHS